MHARSDHTVANAARGLCFVVLLLLAAPCMAQERTRQDQFLEGYIVAILERQLGWERTSFEVSVDDRVATIVLYHEDVVRREQAEQALSKVAGLEQVRVIVTLSPRPGDVPIVFPVGDLFRPLIADPKQPQFFISFIQMKTPVDRITAASVGYGESFGLLRWPGAQPGDGWQLSFIGGLFAQFDLSSPSSDLINADYTVGFRLAHRRGPFSTRWRLYHQSSHLGDEFLLSQPNIERINLSVEAVDFAVSHEWERWRVYGGLGYLINRDPSDLDPGFAEAGIEYRGKRFRWDLGRLVGGLDLRSFEEQHWNIAASFKIGLELGQADSGRRHLRVLAEFYDGSSPFGQFFRTDIRYAGVGVYFGF